jgi:membrane protease YdiL (CAAX protease family)
LEEPVSFGVSVILRMTIGIFFTILFVFGEEVGWSGFATPKLLKISSVTTTTLIVGGYWALWHFPAIIGGIYGSGTPLWIALPGFTLVLIGASFFRTVLRNESGSLWTGVILHASHNMFLMGAFWTLTNHEEKAAYWVSETGVILGLIYILAGILFWRYHTKKKIEPAVEEETA